MSRQNMLSLYTDLEFTEGIAESLFHILFHPDLQEIVIESETGKLETVVVYVFTQLIKIHIILFMNYRAEIH